MILKKQTTSYKEIENDLKTGDIFLMNGLHPSSLAIEAFEGSKWSHAGIIVLAEDLGIDAGDDNVLLWEANSDTPVKDIILDKPKTGPMLVRLSERLIYNIKNKYDKNLFAIRHLHADRSKNTFENFNKVIKEVHKAKFPNIKREVKDPMEGRFFNKRTPLDVMFCSQLVAYTYMKLGLLTESHPSNSYFPVDFSDLMSIGLLKRAWLGNEILLKVENL